MLRTNDDVTLIITQQQKIQIAPLCLSLMRLGGGLTVEPSDHPEFFHQYVGFHLTT